MLRRVLVLAVVTSLAASGCTMSKEGRRGTIVAGLGISAASVLLIGSGANDSDHDGTNDTILNDDWGAYMLGSTLLAIGAAVFVGGLVSSEEPDDRSVTYLPPASAYTSPPPATAYAAPTSTPVFTAAPGMTQTVEITRVPLVALPELPATADVLRLAKQVRSASTNGRCEAAWIMWTDLQRLDGAYARALRDGPVMARCAI